MEECLEPLGELALAVLEAGADIGLELANAAWETSRSQAAAAPPPDAVVDLGDITRRVAGVPGFHPGGMK